MNDDVDKLVARFKRRARMSLGLPVHEAVPAGHPYLESESHCLDSFHQRITGDSVPLQDLLLNEPTDSVYLQEGKPEQRTADTLIISDIHLGSPVCRARDLAKVLRTWTYKRLIILGDLLDNARFQRLCSSQWKMLAYLRSIGLGETDAELVWIAGNHDLPVAKQVSKMIHAELLGEEANYTFDCGGRKYLCLHGHQFDRHVKEYPVGTLLACSAYILIQKADLFRRKDFSRWVKRQSKSLLDTSEQVAIGALDRAKNQKVDAVVCGHTHLALRREMDGRTYINSGCWTETPATLVAIDESGSKLVEYF